MMMRRFFNGLLIQRPIWGLMALYLGLVFFTGGSARADVSSLILLRPAAAILLGWALIMQQRKDWNDLKIVPSFMSTLILLTIAHLAPLPFTVWSSLPGRGLLVDAGTTAGLGEIWRPVSIVPWTTWNTLFSFLVPGAAMVLVAKVGRDAWERVLICLIGIGFFSGAVGFLQAISPTNISLPFYKDTDLVSSFGLFANRNHQAVFLACLFPMLAAFAALGSHSLEQQKFRRLCSVAIGVVLIPMLLVTGSRAGLVAGIFGLASVMFIYRQRDLRVSAKRTMRRSWLPYLFGTSLVFSLAMSALVLSRGEALVRFLGSGGDQEERLKIWATLPSMISKYWPVGSGMGSFVESYQVDEPHARLNYLYVNHAHNEVLELAMTTGLPGLVVVIVAVMLWVLAARRALELRKILNRDAIFFRLGLTILFMLGLASLVDYPLRVPSLACLGIVAAIWTEVSLRRLQSTRSNS